MEEHMFTVDESPERVAATPAATAQLRALTEHRGAVTMLLTDGLAKIMPEGGGLPPGAVKLGAIADAVTVAADGRARTAWWRNRVEIDLTDDTPVSGGGFTFALQPLTEPELYAAVASGPLPRY
jgi:hypothetical protein